MKKIIKIIKPFLKGSGDGLASPVIGILKEIKKLRRSGAMDFLDTNGDGKVNFQDIEELQWKTIGKLFSIVALTVLSGLALLWLNQYFPVIDFLKELLS